MIKQLSWDFDDKKHNLIKLINPDYKEIEKISNEYNFEIDNLMESYDLEQYPYMRKLDNDCISVILDIPVLSESINIFSVPIQIMIVDCTIIVISRVENKEIDALDLIIEIHQGIYDAFVDILSYLSNLYLIKLKNLKRELDKIMQDVYTNNNFKIEYERFAQKMKIELTHYMSSLETNNMVLTHLDDVLFKGSNEDFEDMIIDSKQALDISSLYLNLTSSLFEYFNLHQEKELARKVNRLTTLTISLTIPNMVFGFYGMNVKLPFESMWFAWIGISAFVLVVSMIVYKFTKIDK